MPDREHDDGLEKELGEIGARIEYPPTPDVSRTVRRRIDTERSRPHNPLRMLARPKWVAAAATILLSLTALSPTMRSTISDYASSGASSGASGAGASSAPSSDYAPEATGQPVQEPPSGEAAGGAAAAGAAASGSSAAGPATPPGAALGLGERLSPSEARTRVGELLLPYTLELPVESGVIYAGGPSRGDGIVLVFGPEPGLPPLGDTDIGLLLVETSGNLNDAYTLAERTSGAHLEEVVVGGERGYWLPDGRSLRSRPGGAWSLPGGALLWERGDVALLLRAKVPREEAIRIAESVR